MHRRELLLSVLQSRHGYVQRMRLQAGTFRSSIVCMDSFSTQSVPDFAPAQQADLEAAASKLLRRFDRDNAWNLCDVLRRGSRGEAVWRTR